MDSVVTWLVYVENVSRSGIETYNIFRHGCFSEDCQKIAKKWKTDRARFEKELRSSLMYFFWSKSEWEIVLTSWPPDTSGRFQNRKIDVYDQVYNNWEAFASYCWDHRREMARVQQK